MNMDKTNLRNRLKIKAISLFIGKGLKRISSNYHILAAFVLTTIMYVIMCFTLLQNYDAGVLTAMLKDVWTAIAILGGIVGVILALVLLGMPKQFFAITRNLERAGIVNYAQEVPILIKNEPLGDQKDLIRLTFLAHGFSLKAIVDAQEAIQSALDIAIISIDIGQSYRYIEIVGIPGAGGLPSYVEWSASYLDPSESVINLGIGVAGIVSVDLAVTPHCLFAGSTGSGKSVQIKLALAQLLAKGHEVFLVDFKGGIDYPGKWRELCNLVTNEDECLTRLQTITNELARRKRLLLSVHAPDIRAYNRLTGENLPRIIFAVDELAELTSTTGRSTEDKKRIEKIVGVLSSIARLGRALGIHLILGLQRPDATALPGQIKNNIDFRACGRADNVLSVMVLDNGDAADKIGKLNVGRFLTADGELYQGFYFDNDMLDGMIRN